MTDTPTPTDRAQAAAEELAAAGNPVTARAVQQLAQVGMKVATQVAGAWNEQNASGVDQGPLPDRVRVRFDAVWREAVDAARVAHEADVEEWTTRLAAAHEERDDALGQLSTLQQELAAANARADEAHEQAAGLRAELRSAEAVAARAENRAAAAEGLVTGLREALAALSATSAATAPTPVHDDGES